jgi:hypothetical protein
MQSGTVWWWSGLVCTLLVRLAWLATLQTPQPLDKLGHSLFHQTLSASADGQTTSDETLPTNSAPSEQQLAPLPLGSRYVIYPVVRNICASGKELGVPWYWVLGGLQALFQSAATGGLAVVAWRVFGNRLLVTLTVLVAAMYPPGLSHLVSLSDLPLTSCLVTNWLALTLTSAATGGVLASALVGLLAGCLTVMRPGWGLAVVLVTVWHLWQLRRVRYGWLASLVVVLALANVCGTWFVRHWLQTGEPVPFATSLWQAVADGFPHNLRSSDDKTVQDWRELAHRTLRIWRQHPRSCLQYRLMMWGDVLVGEPAYDFGWPATGSSAVAPDPRLVQTSEQPPELVPHRIPTPRPSEVPISEIPIPAWIRPAFVSGLLPATRWLFWLGVIFGWRWSFALPGRQWPLSPTLGSVLLVYGLGPFASLHWGLAAVEPILLLYALVAFTALIPGAWPKSVASSSSDMDNGDVSPTGSPAEHS